MRLRFPALRTRGAESRTANCEVRSTSVNYVKIALRSRIANSQYPPVIFCEICEFRLRCIRNIRQRNRISQCEFVLRSVNFANANAQFAIFASGLALSHCEFALRNANCATANSQFASFAYEFAHRTANSHLRIAIANHVHCEIV